MWRFSAFCNDKKSKSLAENNSGCGGKKGLYFTSEWENLIQQGISPRELWETRYEEVNRVNSDFLQKFEWKCEGGSKDSMSPSLATAIEQLLLIFGKGYVQEMQGRWEKSREVGRSPGDFWEEERSKFERKHWFWRWGKKSGQRKEKDRMSKSSEFDEEILKD